MRTESQIENLKANKLSALAKRTSDEVSNLPPAYIAGFNLEIENRQITVGRGIAHIRGKRVVIKIAYRVNWGDVWSDITPQAGRKYYIYLDSGATWRIDVVPPVYLDDAYAYYHPIHQDFRYIDVFSVDMQGDYVHDITIVGYYGRGTNDAPQNGDRRTVIDGDEIRIERRIGGAWVTKLKVGGVLATATLLAMIGCSGIYNPENPPITHVFPHPDFRVFNFENNYEDQFGVDNWTPKIKTGFSSTYKKFGSYSLSDDNTNYSSAIYTVAGATIGESQAVGFWIYFRQLPSSLAQVCMIYWDSSNYMLLGVDPTSGNPEMKIIIARGGVQSGISVGHAVAGRWDYVAMNYDKDEDVAAIIYNDKVETYTPAGTWGASADCSLLFEMADTDGLGTYTYRACIDEAIFAFNKTIDPYVFAEHYIESVAWDTSGRTLLDVLLRAGTSGVVYSDSPLTINAAGSEFYNPDADVSMGTLKYFATQVEALNTDPSSTDMQTLDISSHIPAGTKGLLLLCSVDEDGGANRTLELFADSGGVTRVARFSTYTGSAAFGQTIYRFVTPYNLYWQVSNADVDNVTITIQGYYI